MALLSPANPTVQNDEDTGGHRSGTVYQVIPPRAHKKTRGEKKAVPVPASPSDDRTPLLKEPTELNRLGIEDKQPIKGEDQADEDGSAIYDHTYEDIDRPSNYQQETYLTFGHRENKMLPKHEEYHFQISSKVAERRLKKRGGHCYLTRYSESQQSYILSVYKKESLLRHIIEHYRILISNSGSLKIEGKDMEFYNIQHLLNYYENNPITPALSSIGYAYTQKQYTSRKKWHCCGT